MNDTIEMLGSREITWSPEEAAPPAGAASWDLTDRERIVAGLLADGLPYKEIALELNISVNTVASHVKSILRKAGVNSSRRFAAMWRARRD